jgi:hypothetical protein
VSDLSGRHPGTLKMLRWFEYEHLPEHLQPVSRIFHDAAHAIVEQGADGAELSTALRKLLEAKDAGVRSAIEKEEANG